MVSTGREIRLDQQADGAGDGSTIPLVLAWSGITITLAPIPQEELVAKATVSIGIIIRSAKRAVGDMDGYTIHQVEVEPISRTDRRSD